MAGPVDGRPAHLLGIARPPAFPLHRTGPTRVLAGRVVRSVDGTAPAVDLRPAAPTG